MNHSASAKGGEVSVKIIATDYTNYTDIKKSVLSAKSVAKKKTEAKLRKIKPKAIK
jgi:hypothetical protein